MLVAIALANRMARGIWAMMPKKEVYRGPAMVAAWKRPEPVRWET